MTMTPLFQLFLLLSANLASKTLAFLAPSTWAASVSCGNPCFLKAASNDVPLERDVTAVNSSNNVVSAQQKRRDFLFQSAASLIATTSLASFPFIASADDADGTSDERGDLTSQLFNPDGSLRDPNLVIEAQSRTVNLSFSSLPSEYSNGLTANVSTDGSQPTSSSTPNLGVSYNLPTKWNNDQSNPDLPLYFDSSEGKNGKACNRITVYSINAPNMDMKTLDKASTVGVAKSLLMDTIPNQYFDKGVLKADLVSGKTTRKPIVSNNKEELEYDEQVYYEFDLAFAPLECPSFDMGNKENLGLGFCPYDNIFLVSSTVVKNDNDDKNGTLLVCVLECNKDNWKIANSDLKRVRSSFMVDRV